MRLIDACNWTWNSIDIENRILNWNWGSVKNYFPARQDIVPVYAVIVFFIYSWTIVAFLWKIPSWILYLTIIEVLSIFAYTMVTALVESMLLLLFFVILAALLPSKMMKDYFVICGTWLGISILGSMILGLWLYLQGSILVANNIVYWVIGSLLFSFLLVYFSNRWSLLRMFALWFSDRLIVFLFFTVPLSTLSVVVVVLRNIST